MKSSRVQLALLTTLAGLVALLASDCRIAGAAEQWPDSSEFAWTELDWTEAGQTPAPQIGRPPAAPERIGACAASKTTASKEPAAINAPTTPDSTDQPETSDKPDAPDRPLGSAFFRGDRRPRIFAPATDKANGDSVKWPDISQPGPDMGDFPNSAFTLPKGRAYIELAPLTLVNADRQNPAAYFAPFLLRYGLTDDVEFRLIGNGVTHVQGPSPTTGFSPLIIDSKIHLWNDRKEWLIPAMSLEVYLVTPWGSSQFTAAWEPSLNLNFDLPIAKKLNLEWTLGYSGVQQAINVNTREIFVPRFNYLVPGIHRTFDLTFNQFSAQWAVEYEVNDAFQLFAHGFHNGSITLNLGAGEMVGVGGFWKFSPRLVAFGSINTGLTPNLPSVAGQIGFALALGN